jgi:hypothetical protein
MPRNGTVLMTHTHTRTFVYPRAFAGYRHHPPEDYTKAGYSHLGGAPDYEGAIFSDGTVAIRWLTAYASFSCWASYSDFEKVHGHADYGTEIVFADGGEAP